MRAEDARQRVAISEATVRRYAVTAVLLVTSLLFLVVGIGALLDQWRYTDNSRVTEGTVLTIQFKVPRRGAENPKSTMVTYEFQAKDGRVIRGSDLGEPTDSRRPARRGIGHRPLPDRQSDHQPDPRSGRGGALRPLDRHRPRVPGGRPGPGAVDTVPASTRPDHRAVRRGRRTNLMCSRHAANEECARGELA